MRVKQICRICLSSETPFCKSIKEAREAFKNIFNIEVNKSSTELNSFSVCKPCNQELLAFYNFYQKIKANEDKYNLLVTSDNIIKLEVSDDDIEPNPNLTDLDIKIESFEEDEANTDIFVEPSRSLVELKSQKESHICTTCGRTYKSRCSLTFHKRKQHGLGRTPVKPDPVYVCDICGVTAGSKIRLSDHIQAKHLKIRNVICDLCGAKFYKNNDRKVHIRKVHNSDRKREQCQDCGKYFLDLVLHRSRHHVKTGDFPCSKCDKICQSKQQLSHHIQTHLKKSKHICKVCGRQFKESIKLREHMHGIHLGGFLYQCGNGDCDFKTNYKSNLRQHWQKFHQDFYQRRLEQYRTKYDKPDPQ